MTAPGGDRGHYLSRIISSLGPSDEKEKIPSKLKCLNKHAGWQAAARGIKKKKKGGKGNKFKISDKVPEEAGNISIIPNSQKRVRHSSHTHMQRRRMRRRKKRGTAAGRQAGSKHAIISRAA